MNTKTTNVISEQGVIAGIKKKKNRGLGCRNTRSATSLTPAIGNKHTSGLGCRTLQVRTDVLTQILGY